MRITWGEVEQTQIEQCIEMKSQNKTKYNYKYAKYRWEYCFNIVLKSNWDPIKNDKKRVKYI